jgi:hypothetical protein
MDCGVTMVKNPLTTDPSGRLKITEIGFLSALKIRACYIKGGIQGKPRSVRLSFSHLKRGDRNAILVMLAFFGLLFFVAVTASPRAPGQEYFNFGFSRDLQCDGAMIEPVCIRKASESPKR